MASPLDTPLDHSLTAYPLASTRCPQVLSDLPSLLPVPPRASSPRPLYDSSLTLRPMPQVRSDLPSPLPPPASSPRPSLPTLCTIPPSLTLCPMPPVRPDSRPTTESPPDDQHHLPAELRTMACYGQLVDRSVRKPGRRTQKWAPVKKKEGMRRGEKKFVCLSVAETDSHQPAQRWRKKKNSTLKDGKTGWVDSQLALGGTSKEPTANRL